MRIGDPYFLYMCEAEGLDNLVDTRDTKINAVIKDIKDDPRNEISKEDFYRYCSEHDLYNITSDEFSYMLRKVREY